MNPSVRLALAAFLIVLHVGSVRAELRLERVTRSGFSMDMPRWLADRDLDRVTEGVHVRDLGLLGRAEVSWTHDPGVDLAELDAANAALDKGSSLSRLERRVERPPGQLRLFTLQSGKDAWKAVTQIACHDSGVLATVSASAKDRDAARSLHDAMVGTFECRPADVAELEDAWPSTFMLSGFGLYDGGDTPLLVHPDGRWMSIAKIDPDTVFMIGTDRELAGQTFRRYGTAMKDTWELQVGALEHYNASGRTFLWELAGSRLGEISASAFQCGRHATGYLLFAGNFKHTSDQNALIAMTMRVACPHPDRPWEMQTRSACDVGVTEYCFR